MDTAENWYALSLSIIGDLTPDQAIRWIEGGQLTDKTWKKMRKSIRNLSKERPKRLPGVPASKEEVEERRRLRRQETIKMAEMRRNGMNYTEIGKTFNLHKSYVRTRIINYEKENT